MDPGHAQIGDVAGVDLGERTIVVRLVGAVVGQPVVLAAGFDARGIHRLRQAWRGGKHRASGNSGRYSNGYSKITRLLLPLARCLPRSEEHTSELQSRQ